MEKEEKVLDYFRDKDNNYIIRRVWTEDDGKPYFMYSGTYDAIFIFKKENFEQQIQEKFEQLCDEIEQNCLQIYKIEKKSFLFEKILGNFLKEEKYNPLFSKMSKEEALALQGNGIKAKIQIKFEIHVNVEKHLKFKAFKEFILGRSRTNFR